MRARSSLARSGLSSAHFPVGALSSLAPTPPLAGSLRTAAGLARSARAGRTAFSALLVTSLFASPPDLGAQFVFFDHFGARAAALGGAFTAVADDTSAFYWNPAGYAFGPAAHASFNWGESESDRGGLVSSLGSPAESDDAVLLTDRVAGFALGLTFMGVAGNFSRQTASTLEGNLLSSRGLRTFDLSFSILQSLPIDDLVVAANVHYLRGETFELVEPAAEIPEAARSASSIADRVFEGPGVASSSGTLDLAALYEPSSWLRVGFMWRRLVEPEFSAPTGGDIVLPRHARAGVAFALPREALVSLDFDLSSQGGPEERWREVSVGAEKRLFDESLALRAGLRAETGSGRGTRAAFSVGAGGRIRFLVLEVAYVGAPDERDEAFWVAVTVSP
jgi:hypothetical protein